MTRIGAIGTGHIAAPMVRFLAERGHRITVTQRNTRISADLARSHGVSVAEAPEVVEASDILILCLRPHLAPAALRDLPFRPDQRIVSVMAGISRADLERLCGPVRGIVRTIPLGFLEQGGCPLAAHGDAELLSDLFAPGNPVIEVADEAALNAHFAICALVPGMLEMMAGASEWLATATGNTADAERYTTELMAGFLSSLGPVGAGQLARERDALATEGTISLQMVNALRDDGAGETLTRTLDAIGQRLDARS